MNINVLKYKFDMLLSGIFWTFANKLKFTLSGVSFGKGFHSTGSIFVRNAGVISIGNHVNVNSSHKSNPIGGERTTLFTCRGAEIKIGDKVGMSNVTVYARQSVVIEDEAVIGGGTKIYDTDFHSVIADYRMNGNTKVPIKPVVLKSRCFVGANCIILKGVTVGTGSVIGAGSVVTKSVPDGEIWAGVPAKFIKKVPEN